VPLIHLALHAPFLMSPPLPHPPLSAKTGHAAQLSKHLAPDQEVPMSSLRGGMSNNAKLSEPRGALDAPASRKRLIIAHRCPSTSTATVSTLLTRAFEGGGQPPQAHLSCGLLPPPLSRLYSGEGLLSVSLSALEPSSFHSSIFSSAAVASSIYLPC